MSKQLQYQRDFEREADFLGLGYVAKSGYDPAGMLALLRKMYDEQKLNPTLVPPYLMSHPLTGERLGYIEATLKKNEWQMAVHEARWDFVRAKAIVRGYAQTRAQAVPPYERRLEAAETPEQRGMALELIGLLMTHGDDFDLAIKYLVEAETLGRQVNRELGRAYLRKNKLADAEPRLRKAVERDAKDWNAVSDLGETFYLQGKYQDAVARFETAVELFPHDPRLMQQFGRALDKADRTAEGFYWFAKASEFRGDGVQALSYYERAIEGLPKGDKRRKEIEEKIEKLKKENSGPLQAPRVPRPGRLIP
jgi:predicted Zn-dependent protease